MTIYTLCENNINNRTIRYLAIGIMNLIGIPLILFWTITGIFLFPLAFVFMKTILGYSTLYLTRKCIWIYGRVWQWLLSLFVEFVPPVINGNPFKESGIIVVNHRSFFDTYCMNMMPVSDVCFAVRDWPFRIPFYNIFMKLAGYLNIEKYSWEKMLAISGQNLADNAFILFFPEGHRSTNNQMTRFYSGAFKMAVENNVPVIPICLTGTEDLLPPRRSYIKPAKIKMEILNPVSPDRFTGDMKHIELQKHVKNIMAKCIAKMDE